MIIASWKDYADKLNFTMNQIDRYCDWKHPLIITVINYLKKWKPNTTLSRIQIICRNELHHIGANVLEEYKAVIKGL